MVNRRTLARPAKRKQALPGSNPPRNSRPETPGDAADADGRCSPASLLMAWWGIGHHRRFPHPWKTHRGARDGGEAARLVLSLERDGRLIAERGVQALAVVDLIDEGRDVARRVAVIAIERAVNLFAFERPDEALGLGIVVGIADPAHAGGDPRGHPAGGCTRHRRTARRGRNGGPDHPGTGGAPPAPWPAPPPPGGRPDDRPSPSR